MKIPKIVSLQSIQELDPNLHEKLMALVLRQQASLFFPVQLDELDLLEQALTDKQPNVLAARILGKVYFNHAMTSPIGKSHILKHLHNLRKEATNGPTKPKPKKRKKAAVR